MTPFSTHSIAMKTIISPCHRLTGSLVIVALLMASVEFAFAGRHLSVRRNVNVRSNTHINRDVHVRRDIDIDIDRHHHSGFGVGLAAGVITGAAVGALVSSPPRGYTTVYVGSSPYAYYGGTYYQQGPSGYMVVAPPIGAIVPVLPPGATVAVVNGVTYYVFNGIYYQPVFVNGVTQFRTVRF